MKYYYDLHIHTALSLCADDDMTPCNITGLSLLSNLDIIAVTDHNSAGNAESVIKASRAKNGPLVVPGMEVTTLEEIHVLMLFDSLDGAITATDEIKTLGGVKIKNNPEKYGRQLYMDENDNITGEEGFVLSAAVNLSIDDAAFFAKRFGGVCIPAHIDAPSYSVIGVLGYLSDELGFSTVELTKRADEKLVLDLKNRGYNIIQDSDSHFLGALNERDADNSIELSELSLKALIKKLSVNNLSNLTPHPVYVFFHYSHPTLLQRIRKIST